jgi:AcrR family transcriptional regulator
MSPARELPFFVSVDDSPSKSEILKAALRLFVTSGRAATTIRDIAAESGYTNPALFKYFSGKDELATQLFVRCYEHLSDRLREAVTSQAGFSDRIFTIVDIYCAMLDRAGEADALLYVQDSLRDLWPAVRRTLQRKSIVRLMLGVVEDGRREGVVAPDVEPRMLVAAILGVLAQFSRQHYFEDFSGPAKRWAPSLRKVIHRMCLPQNGPQ